MSGPAERAVRENTQELPVLPPPVAGTERVWALGVAAVPPAGTVPTTEPTLTQPAGAPRRQLRVRLRQLRKGGSLSSAGLLVLLLCWAVWAFAEGTAQWLGALAVLAVMVAVAVLLFTMSRLLGGLFWERLLGRTRRSAWPSHVLAGGFLVFVAYALLSQVQLPGDWAIEWQLPDWDWLREREE